ncbi:hypothetical protein R1sor_002917 [Riccia sorocarpa]|uniref:tRNA(Ile)-lysidine synthetase n=1 Tax=Riccia sorocarpa TaxID=122646 RepID=A0ABD3H3I6_9MARC
MEMSTNPPLPTPPSPPPLPFGRAAPKPPSARELIEHYKTKGLDQEAATEKALEDMQKALTYAVQRFPKRAQAMERSVGSVTNSLEYLCKRMDTLEAKLDTKPSLAGVFGAGAAAGTAVLWYSKFTYHVNLISSWKSITGNKFAYHSFDSLRENGVQLNDNVRYKFITSSECWKSIRICSARGNFTMVTASAEENTESSQEKKSHRKRRNLEAQLVKRLGQAITERQLMRPKQRILVAVSGGQDSVCLLHLMVKLRETWDWSIGVVNCDHQWSASSRQASALVAQLAQSMDLDYYQSVSTRSVLGEGVARTWRYGVLQRVALTHGYEVIVTAHTASDRVETLLYNLFRGSGISGLQSLTWKRSLDSSPSLTFHSAFRPDLIIENYDDPNGESIDSSSAGSQRSLALVRPLLEVTRSELRELHHQLGLPLWPDPSNHTLDIDRNRIRHELLPYLRKHFNQGVDKSLARWAEILHGEQLYLDNLCRSILSKIESEVEGPGGGRKLDVLLLKSLPIALQRRILKQFSDNVTGKSLGFDAVERLRLAASGESSGTRKSLQLSVHGGFTIQLKGDILTIARHSQKCSGE